MLLVAMAPAGALAAAFDAEGVYHATIGIQTPGGLFRGGEDGQFGLFHDVEIKGNGTYLLIVSDIDFGGEEAIDLIFISTDIPLTDSPIVFSDVTLRMDGDNLHKFDDSDENRVTILGVNTQEEKEFYEVHCINGLFEYPLPTHSISIEFTVSGFAYDQEMTIF